jgi:putative ABC transport system permease protein
MAFPEDVRFGLRMWARNPGFVAVAVSALALGIGANATVFSITDGVLFKGMPFDSNERVLYLATKNLNKGERRSGVSWLDFRDWQAQSKSFQGMAASIGLNANVSDKNGPPEHYQASQIIPNAFRVIGQKPALGRDFSDADGQAGAPPVALLGYGMWETRYGRNPDIVGRIIRINDTQTTVVGVMPKGFTFPGSTEFWVPLIPSTSPSGGMDKRETRNLFAFGRMRDGVTAKSAALEMETIARNLERAYPATNHGIAPVVHTFSEENNGEQLVSVLTALMGAVGFVLLMKARPIRCSADPASPITTSLWRRRPGSPNDSTCSSGRSSTTSSTGCSSDNRIRALPRRRTRRPDLSLRRLTSRERFS